MSNSVNLTIVGDQPEVQPSSVEQQSELDISIAKPGSHGTSSDVKAFVGHNVLYDDKQFRQHRHGESFSFHWRACFCTMTWLAYRRLYGVALIYFLLPYLLIFFSVVALSVLSGRSVNTVGDSALVTILMGYWVATFYIPGRFANHWYYNAFKRRRRQARGIHPNKRAEFIAKNAGTSMISAILVTVVYFGFIGALAILWLF